jgi:hypothetical protein
VDSQTGLVGAFDTLYLITGSIDSLGNSKIIIISTIQDDFDNSPTIGYVRLDNVTEEVGGASLSASIVNPFADQQMDKLDNRSTYNKCYRLGAQSK